MATFRADITKNIEPAMANPATLARATELKTSAITGLAKFANEAYQGYVAGEIANIEEQGSELAKEFFMSGQAATQAGRQISAIEGATTATMFEALNRPQIPEAQVAINKQLSSFDTELTRLKLAVEGGMSNEQYVSRVDTLTKQAIAKYPGQADKIRERLGVVTGLPYADRWAQMSYVKDRFTPAKEERGPKVKTAEDVALQDIDEAAKVGMFGTREELLNLYRTDRGRYDLQMDGFKQVLETQTKTKIIEANVTRLRGEDDFKADQQRPSFAAVFSGGLGTSVLTQSVQDKENVFGTVLGLMAKGDNVSTNIVPFETSIKLHQAQMRTNIENAKRLAYTSIDTYIANNPNISDTKRKELYADIDRSSNLALGKYADDKGVGLVAMANIMRTYRDKTLAEKSQLVDLAIKQQTAMQNNPMVMAYWAGGASRENLKTSNRSFYEFMVKQEEELTGSIAGVRDDIKAATDLANVQRVLTQSQQSPASVPADPVASPSVIRAAHQAQMASATEVLKKAELTPSEINIVSAALSTSTEYGANSLILSKDYRKIGDKILKLSEPDQAIIKSNVSTSIQQAVRNVQDMKTTIDEKYKVKLQVGVNDAGQIVVTSPTQTQTIAKPRLGTTPGTFVAPSTTYQQASAEFTKQMKPMLNNMVYGRSMLTQETPQVVGADFATVINSNQPYNGFFSMEAKPATVAATTSNGGTSLKVGDVVNGFTYNGGDPNVESSWSKK